MMIVIAGTAMIRAEDRDEAIQKAQWMVKETTAEAGCISYTLYAHPLEAEVFFIFEEWESAEALEHHFQTPHMRDFSAYLAKVLTGPLNIKRYEVVSVAAL